MRRDTTLTMKGTGKRFWNYCIWNNMWEMGVALIWLWLGLHWEQLGRNEFNFPPVLSVYPRVTLTAHFTASAVSSDTTMSTHFRLGARSLRICFLTIASKARSGVKRPVLKGGVKKWPRGSRGRIDRYYIKEGEKKKKRKVFVQLVIFRVRKVKAIE